MILPYSLILEYQPVGANRMMNNSYIHSSYIYVTCFVLVFFLFGGEGVPEDWTKAWSGWVEYGG